VAAGDYYYSFRLNNSAGNTLAVVSEIVQIRARLSSEKTIALTEANLNALPAAPAAPLIEAGDGQLTVSWTAVAMASDYEVYYSGSDTQPATPWQTIHNMTTATISSLTNGTTYYVWIKAKNNAGTSESSPVASETPQSPFVENSITIALASQTDVNLPSQSTDIVQGESGTFQVTGSYTSHQWYLDGSTINGATTSSYTLNTALMLVGLYELSVVVTTDATERLSGSCYVNVSEPVGTPAAPSVPEGFVALSGAMVTGSGSSGVFISGSTVTVASFAMAKYETTYELWYEVRVWAEANGYTFVNQGRNGYQGTTNHPVTMVSWRDIIVWCNAYSEKENRQPVYTYNGVVIRSSSDTTACDNAMMDKSKSGFRLPTEVEWEFAARGGNPSDTTNWSYTYAGSNTVGDVAWYGSNSESNTHPVGTKVANSAGLSDMSGNVWEWCWDWYDSVSSSTPTDGASAGSIRVLRGGDWGNVASNADVSYRYSLDPYSANDDFGFRVVCPPSS
jgi:formylglycine-generating enzyme required for sulfatase activity